MPITSRMRDDIKVAMRGRSVTFLGARRERKKLVDVYLHADERVDDLLACSYGDTGGRSLLVATNERVLAVKDGWVFKNSQSIGYKDIRSIEIRTGLFWSEITFIGEGNVLFEVKKAGRFSADRLVKLVRTRIGSRHAAYQRQVEAETAAQNPSVPQNPTTVLPVQPATGPQLIRPTRPNPTLQTPTQSEPELSLGDLSRLAETTPPTKDLYSQLQQLENNYQAGLLSDGEFAYKKRQLLS